MGKIKDPFDTFDWLMDKSEAIGVKSRFYFMSDGVTKYDNRYRVGEPKALKLMKKIKREGTYYRYSPIYNGYYSFQPFYKGERAFEKSLWVG